MANKAAGRGPRWFQDVRLVDNTDGTYSLAVREQGGGGGSADFGTALTGETLETGGVGNLGWLSSVRKAVKDRLGDTTVAEATGDGSVIAILKRLRTLLGGTLNTALRITDASDANTPVGYGATSLFLPLINYRGDGNEIFTDA